MISFNLRVCKNPLFKKKPTSPKGQVALNCCFIGRRLVSWIPDAPGLLVSLHPTLNPKP